MIEKQPSRKEPLDAEIGRRIRTRRLQFGISQSKLANNLGITFQQVQKYEKGTNRVTAGRLQRIADTLDVPVAFFFDDTKAGKKRTPGVESSLFSYLQSGSAIRMVIAFYEIKNESIQRAVVKLVENIARTQR